MNLEADNGNHALDGLRAVAVVFVLVIHSGWDIPLVKTGGASGVDIFFVLSGYLITGILRKELIRTKKIHWFRFCLNRLIRLWPALLTVVTVTVAIGLSVFTTKTLLLQNAFFGVTFSYMLFSGFLNGEKLAYGHLWTLSVEQAFYLFFPFLLILTNRIKLTRITLMVMLASVGLLLLCGTAFAGALTPHEDGPRGLWGYARAGGLLLGASLAIFLEMDSRKKHQIFDYLGASVVFSSLAVSTYQPMVGLSYLLADVGAVLSIYAMAGNQKLGIVSRILSSRPLVQVGVISYEIYLWHWPLLCIAVNATSQPFQTASWWSYSLAFLLAALTHQLWLPTQRLLRRKLNAWSA